MLLARFDHNQVWLRDSQSKLRKFVKRMKKRSNHEVLAFIDHVFLRSASREVASGRSRADALHRRDHCFAAIHAALLTSTATMLARHLTATPQTVATSVSARRAAATAASAAATAAASAGTDLDRAAAYLAAVLAAARPPPAGLPAGP